MTTVVTNPPTVNAKPPPPLPKTPAPITEAPRAAHEHILGKAALRLAIDVIDECPTNVRKRFPSEEVLRELGQSIQTHGLLQEVLVRPHPSKKDRFELVFGACRYRASKLVGLKTIDAKCRDLSDVEVLEIQILENQKRTDVHPLEEAEGYEQLHTKHGYDVDTIAAKVRKSRSYVYQRMKLLSLCPEARTAFYDGVLPATVAIYVARIPSKKGQAEAVKTIVQGYGGDPMSAREAAEHVQGKYMLKMASAPFSTKDATLVAAAGACDTCPKRTKVAKELFPDVKHDMCTDPDCFATKREADAKRRIAKAKEEGTEILSVKVDPQGWDYGSAKVVALEQQCNEDPKGRTYRELLKGTKVPLALARGPEGEVVEVAKREDFEPVLAKKLGRPKERTRNDDEHREVAAISKKCRELVGAELAARVERRKPTAAFYVGILCAFEERGMGTDISRMLARRDLLENDRDERSLQEVCSGLDEAVLRGLIAESLASDYGSNRDELLKAYGVDEKAIEKQAKAAVKAEAKEAKK